jgi:predicted phage terminase large subunit-like protein
VTQALTTTEALTPDELDSIREQAKSDLFFFAKGILGFDKLTPNIHLPLCLELEQYETQHRLEITLPRGWFKTTVVSKAYPVWRAIRDPNVRILLAQNTFTNAESKLKTIDDIFNINPLFRMLFPELLPDTKCQWTSASKTVRRTKSSGDEGTFEAAGTRTQVTSRHYDCIIEDDTVAPDQDDLGEQNLCPTKDDIAQAIGWHRLVPPLLVHPMESQNIVVGTRWFEKDLISWIHENEHSYFKFYERAVRETGGIPNENGEYTFPERFGEAVCDHLKVSMGPYLFSCLYMNKPMRSEDMVFHPEWFEYYETESKQLVTYTTVDPAGDPEDSKGEPDFNVVMTCGKDLSRGTIFVLDYKREKCSPGRLIDMIFEQVRRWNPVKVGVESVAYQKSLCYWIRERQKQEDKFFLVDTIVNNRKSKNARIMGLQPLVQSRTLVFRRWMTSLVNELLSFPLGKNDDLADALAMQLNLWAMTRSRSEAKKQMIANDPLSCDQAIRELRNRHSPQARGCMDILQRKSMMV